MLDTDAAVRGVSALLFAGARAARVWSASCPAGLSRPPRCPGRAGVCGRGGDGPFDSCAAAVYAVVASSFVTSVPR